MKAGGVRWWEALEEVRQWSVSASTSLGRLPPSRQPVQAPAERQGVCNSDGISILLRRGHLLFLRRRRFAAEREEHSPRGDQCTRESPAGLSPKARAIDRGVPPGTGADPPRLPGVEAYRRCSLRRPASRRGAALAGIKDSARTPQHSCGRLRNGDQVHSALKGGG